MWHKARMPFDARTLERYVERVRALRSDPGHNPEVSLYPALQELLESAAAEWRPRASVVPQSRRQCGVPDFALLDASGRPFGYVEAKAPGTSLRQLRGQDKVQFERYKELPCVLYTNYAEAILFVEGEEVDSAPLAEPSALDPDVRRPPPAPELAPLLRLGELLFTREPEQLRAPAQIAERLARRARLVREVVAEVMHEEGTNPLTELYREFGDVLFADLNADRFADSYGQTLAYGLLLARILHPQRELSLETAPGALGSDHRLLSSALRLLGQPEAIERIGWSIEALIETARSIDPERLLRASGEDPTIYFYEHFLRAYNPELRKSRGVYYTPVEVVRFQVRAIDQLLREELGADEGLADPNVSILDPATGTGTYLLGVFMEVAERLERERGRAAVAGALRDLAKRSFGFELLVGPYAVARWRLATYLHEHGVAAAPQVVLTDTLAPPSTDPAVHPRFGFLSQALTEERADANRVKREQPIQVILGNPPYERTNLRADDAADGAETGRWDWIWRKVDDFKRLSPPAERRNQKNWSDRYLLFYRWAFWKLLDEEAAGPGKGIVTFISNRTFVSGEFAGMRAYMREQFQRIIIVDLGGDQNAARLHDAARDEPVFEIKIGVAIAICLRNPGGGPCRVLYRRLQGTSEEKLSALNALGIGHGFEEVPGSGGESFAPLGSPAFRAWPSLPQLFEAKFPGIESSRESLVVAPNVDQLRRSIQAFARADDARATELFHPTRSRGLPEPRHRRFDADSAIQVAYCPLDRRYMYFRPDFVDWSRPELQTCWGAENRALMTLPRKHGSGPAAFAHALLPGRHAFRGSLGGHIFPLWDARRQHGRRRASNLRPELLASLLEAYGEAVSPESVFDYVYAILQAPSYTRRFHEELQQSFPRVPFPKERRLFDNNAERGESLVSLHCFERRAARGENPSRLEGEDAAIGDAEHDSEERRVKLGGDVTLTEVTTDMWTYEVSGYRVLPRWLEARKGLTLAPEEIRELLAVTFALRKTIELGPRLDEALERILERPQLDLSSLHGGEDDPAEEG